MNAYDANAAKARDAIKALADIKLMGHTPFNTLADQQDRVEMCEEIHGLLSLSERGLAHDSGYAGDGAALRGINRLVSFLALSIEAQGAPKEAGQ